MNKLPRFNKAIGSTDITALAGTSPFAGPWEVYNRITKPRKEEGAEASHLSMGRDLEQWLLTAVARLDPRWLVLLGLPSEAAETFRVKEGLPIHSTAGSAVTRSTPDGRVVLSARHRRPVMSVEAKTCFYGSRQDWGRPLGDYDTWVESAAPLHASTVPANYYDQCQWHMRHAGTRVCLLPVVFNYTTTVPVYVVVRDDDRIAALERLADRFWTDCVIGDRLPPPDASEGMKQHLALQEAASEEYLPGDSTHEGYLDGLEAAKAKIAEGEAEKKTWQNQLRAAIVDSGGIGLYFNSETRKGRVSYKENKRGVKTLVTTGAKRL